ncbi:MAG: hypothetical protein U0793_28740 [Gemmataceae bacterium]
MQLPGQKHAFFGLLTPTAYMITPTGANRLYAWLPFERYSTLIGWDPTTGNEIFNFNDGKKGRCAASPPALQFRRQPRRHRRTRRRRPRLRSGEQGNANRDRLDRPRQGRLGAGDIAFTPDGATLIAPAKPAT